jgi:hypothetical protein
VRVLSLCEDHSRRSEDLDLTDISTESELFALGSSLYEIMTASKPYQGHSMPFIKNAYRTGTFPDLSLLEAFNNANRRLLQ